MYKLVEKTCGNCSVIFLGSKHRKYCGYSCAKETRKKRLHIICLHCNKQFEVAEWHKNAKFCSKECKVLNQSSLLEERHCEYCNNLFKRKEHKLKQSKHNFCSKFCANKFNTGSNHYEWKEHLHDKNLKLALKQWGNIVKERDNYMCQLCGENNKKILEAHHIKHRSNFPELQFDFNNGITLCLDCHALQHINDVKALRLIKCKMAKKK
jgi:endogenous inhibitor of DNA gyrase (YacG/DUF329 family)